MWGVPRSGFRRRAYAASEARARLRRRAQRRRSRTFPLASFHRPFRPPWARPEYDEMGKREIDHEARCDRQELRRRNRQPKRRQHQHRRVGNDAGDAGGNEGAIGAPAQLPAGFGGEREVAIHHVRTGDRDQPGEHVGWDQRQAEKIVTGKEDAVVDDGIDHADESETRRLERDRAFPPSLCEAALEMLERRGEPHGGLPLSTSRPPRRGCLTRWQPSCATGARAWAITVPQRDKGYKGGRWRQMR